MVAAAKMKKAVAVMPESDEKQTALAELLEVQQFQIAIQDQELQITRAEVQVERATGDLLEAQEQLRSVLASSSLEPWTVDVQQTALDEAREALEEECEALAAAKHKLCTMRVGAP